MIYKSCPSSYESYPQVFLEAAQPSVSLQFPIFQNVKFEVHSLSGGFKILKCLERVPVSENPTFLSFLVTKRTSKDAGCLDKFPTSPPLHRIQFFIQVKTTSRVNSVCCPLPH